MADDYTIVGTSPLPSDAKPSPFAPIPPPATSPDGAISVTPTHSLGFDPTPAERNLLSQIRQRESSGNYQARNPDSTASGAYQFINSTWRLASDQTGVPQYPTAKQAPQWVQDVNALHMLRQHGPNASITWQASGPYRAQGNVAQDTTAPAAATATAGPTSADDLLQRIAAGEDVEITPQVLAQIALGPQKQAAAPATTPEQPEYTITGTSPAPPPSPPPPSFGQQLLTESVVNPARQVAAGALGASAEANRLTANVFNMADSLAGWISQTTGLEKGTLFKDISDWARTNQAAQQKQAAELASGRTDLASQIYRGGTQGLLEIPQVVVASRLGGGVVPGMAALGAIRESDQGWGAALRAAAEGALTGGALEVMGPASRMIRLSGAGAMAYAQARLNGADNATALANAVTTGGMAAIPGGGVTLRELVPGVDTAAQAVRQGAINTLTAAGRGVRGATAAATETVPLRKFGVDINVPKPFVTGAGASAVAHLAGVPYGVGTGAAFTAGAAAPIFRGFMRGVRGVTEVAPEIAAEVTPEAVARSAGQVLAESNGVTWDSLRPQDQKLYEDAARAQANAAAQSATAQPRPAPQPVPAEAAPPRTIEEIQQDISDTWKRLQDLTNQPRTPATEVGIRSEWDRLRNLQQEPYSPPGETTPMGPHYAPTDTPPRPPPPPPPMLPAEPPTPEEQAIINQPPIQTVTETAPPVQEAPPAAQDFESQLAESIRQVEARKQAAQAEAEAPQPTFQERARAKKVDALFNFITNKEIPLSFVETMGKDEWRVMSGKDYADIANPPSAETIRQVKARLAAHEAAQNVTITPTTTPGEAQAAFEQARNVRTQAPPEPAPTQQEPLQPQSVQPPPPPATSEPTAAEPTPSPATGSVPAASVQFGKESTSGGKRQFTVLGLDAEGQLNEQKVQITQRPSGGYIVEQSYYETPPGPENRYGRTATRQIGGTYTKSEARDVAEAYLTGQPHPFAAIEAGQPFSEYQAGTGKLEVPHMGFPHGTIEGEPAWTDGHVMFKGEAPGKITEQDIQMDRVWNQAKEAAQRDYQPVATYREDLRNIVVLADAEGNPVTVDAKYFDVARKRYKNAIFRASSPKDSVSVWQPQADGTPQMVGVIAPVRLQHIDNLPKGVRNILQERQPTPAPAPRPRRTRRTLKNLMEQP